MSIQNNEVWNGGETAAGIFLHRSSDSAIVKGNHIYDMNVSPRKDTAYTTYGLHVHAYHIVRGKLG